jgi:hypothetical protein
MANDALPGPKHMGVEGDPYDSDYTKRHYPPGSVPAIERKHTSRREKSKWSSVDCLDSRRLPKPLTPARGNIDEFPELRSVEHAHQCRLGTVCYQG